MFEQLKEASLRTTFEEASGNLHLDLDQVLEFFVIYSRFEFSLKDSGFVVKNKADPDKEQKLEANYDTFAKSINSKFEKVSSSDTKIKEAVDFYKSAPPRKQVLKKQKPEWVEVSNDGNLATYMLRLVRHVRNNLFHGGKGWLPPEGNSERDKKLMAFGIVIIDAMKNCNADVEKNFSTYA